MTKTPRILVVGDCMLDQSLIGKTSRLSPEAPVPVICNPYTEYSPGGAANTAANAASLGASVCLVGLVGQDANANRLIDRICASSVGAHMVRVPDSTVVKTRVYSGKHFLLRIDSENVSVDNSQIPSKAVDLMDRFLPDVMILSNYNKGCLANGVGNSLRCSADQRNIKVLVDPKGNIFNMHQGSYLIKPNLTEAFEAVGMNIPDRVDNNLIARIATQIKLRSSSKNVIITRGIDGMTVCEDDIGEGWITHVPAWKPKQVFDVTGAGDTAMAALGVAIAEGMSVAESARFASVAAGLAVGEPGTAVIRRADVDDAISADRCRPDPKIFTIDEIVKWSKTRNIAFANGCFDLLHLGHISLLEFAKAQVAKQGGYLVVAVDSDSRVKALKGSARPVLPLDARCKCLAALSCVDAVVPFSTDVGELIKLVKPAVLVKGAEYTNQEVVGASMLSAWGGRLALAPILDNWSTTEVISRVGGV